jgi:hypothetical protein
MLETMAMQTSVQLQLGELSVSPWCILHAKDTSAYMTRDMRSMRRILL